MRKHYKEHNHENDRTKSAPAALLYIPRTGITMKRAGTVFGGIDTKIESQPVRIEQMNHSSKRTIGVFIAAMLTLSPALAGDLASYRWKNRLLLLFAPSESEPGFADFDRRLAQERLGVADRDLVVFRIMEEGPSRVAQQPLPPEDVENLRRRFEVVAGRFTAILIGKDGGVKMRREHRADLREIFDRIDSMPMRQQEMREKDDRP